MPQTSHKKAKGGSLRNTTWLSGLKKIGPLSYVVQWAGKGAVWKATRSPDVICLFQRTFDGYDFEVDPTPTKMESPLGKWVIFSAIQQVVLVVLAGFVLDDGETGRTVLCACGAYWAGIIIIVIRRRDIPYSWSDRFFGRWGFLALLVITPIAWMGIEYLKNH